MRPRVAARARPASPERQRLQLDERRAQLIELGLTLFADRAYDEVSIDDIAAAAGVSKGLLYHYFGSKRAFYVETVRAGAALLRERTRTDPSLPPVDRARAGIEGYLAFVESNARAYASLMRSGIGNDPEVAAVVEETRDAIVGQILEDTGTTDRPVFRFAVRSWVGLVEAASLDWIERREVGRDVALAMMIDSLYGSLAIALRFDPEGGFRFGEILPGGQRTP